MTMKIPFIYVLVLLLASCSARKEQKETTATDSVQTAKPVYQCPMHPEIIRDKPGACPICGMDLVLRETENSHKSHDSLAMDQNTGTSNDIPAKDITWIHPEFATHPVMVSASGYVDYDTRRIYDIPSRIEGRVEALFVTYAFQPIKQGQALYDIYSHELQTAQNEYLYLKKNVSDRTLLQSARDKLLLQGMTASQVDQLKEQGHIHSKIRIYSPYSGYLLPKQKTGDQPEAPSGASMSSGMPSATNKAEQSVELHEGMYLRKGEAGLSIVNTAVVAAIFELYAGQLKDIKIGQKVYIIPEGSGEKHAGKIDLIEPAYRDGSSRARVRVYLSNSDGSLKKGMLLKGEIDAGMRSGLWIPRTAIYDLGKESIVFVRKQERFEAQKIQVAAFSGKLAMVTEGLEGSQEIADDASWMTDSESFIKTSN